MLRSSPLLCSGMCKVQQGCCITMVWGEGRPWSGKSQGMSAAAPVCSRISPLQRARKAESGGSGAQDGALSSARHVTCRQQQQQAHATLPGAPPTHQAHWMRLPRLTSASSGGGSVYPSLAFRLITLQALFSKCLVTV